MQSKAIVLLSGGLDSTTTLAIARSNGFECLALTLNYGQLHQAELEAARTAAKKYALDHVVMELDMRPIAASALTRKDIVVPKHRSQEDIGAPGDIPPTYVPARNTVFLSLATAWAESVGSHDIFIGANVLDASGYPDCRPAFLAQFEELIRVGTRAGAKEGGIRIQAPLIELSKADIIRRGLELGIDYAETHSCYAPTGALACGACDACQLRAKGFREAGVPDPTRYADPKSES